MPRFKCPSDWTPTQRLNQRTKVVPSGCWIFAGATNRGYGQLTIAGETHKAHRLAWEIANNQNVPAGLFVCHRCDVRSCVNPAHLFVGTHDDNMTDMIAKGRDYRGEPARGSNHARAIIDESIAIEIYYAIGRVSHIAERFRVARAVVRGIKRRDQWAHIMVSGPPGATTGKPGRPSRLERSSG